VRVRLTRNGVRPTGFGGPSGLPTRMQRLYFVGSWHEDKPLAETPASGSAFPKQGGLVRVGVRAVGPMLCFEPSLRAGNLDRRGRTRDRPGWLLSSTASYRDLPVRGRAALFKESSALTGDPR
jgi:hypothetical protein